MSNCKQGYSTLFEIKIPEEYNWPSQYTSSDFEEYISSLNTPTKDILESWISSIRRVYFYNTLINLVKEFPNDMELGAAVREYVNKQQNV